MKNTSSPTPPRRGLSADVTWGKNKKGEREKKGGKFGRKMGRKRNGKEKVNEVKRAK
jgi:hypothetical protein